ELGSGVVDKGKKEAASCAARISLGIISSAAPLAALTIMKEKPNSTMNSYMAAYPCCNPNSKQSLSALPRRPFPNLLWVMAADTKAA
ncbi:hypothetical protein Tco_1087998, partial [Tanacetum coccineum]